MSVTPRGLAPINVQLDERWNVSTGESEFRMAITWVDGSLNQPIVIPLQGKTRLDVLRSIVEVAQLELAKEVVCA